MKFWEALKAIEEGKTVRPTYLTWPPHWQLNLENCKEIFSKDALNHYLEWDWIECKIHRCEFSDNNYMIICEENCFGHLYCSVTDIEKNESIVFRTIFCPKCGCKEGKRNDN